MARQKGTLKLGSNIEPNLAAPLDARSVVDQKSDLTANGSFPYSYIGMTVTVKSEQKMYMLTGNDPTDIQNWLEVGKDTDLSDYYNKEKVDELLAEKVDVVEGKGLSTEDYTTEEKTKLSGIAAGAEVNVQPDWSESDTGSDAYILHKPESLPASDVYDWAKEPTKPTYSYAEITGLGTAAAKDYTNSYAADGTDVITGTGVAAALATLAVAEVGGALKYIKAISESGGKISATLGDVDTVVTSGSSNLITSGAVFTAIDNLPEPMVFKGSLGTGGTITALPVDGSATIGDTYKVIEDGTYAGEAARVGDTFICLTKTSSVNTWELIPSGDDPSGTGTVTSIKIQASSPITIDDDSAITTSGVRTISHATSGITAGTYRSVTVDTYGHVTAGSNPTSLSGYGIIDAKIENGVITLGSNTITPLTQHQDISGKADKATTLAGYGITDAYISSGTIYLGSSSITPLTSYTETDPTVPAWAKASTKPSYSYSEISGRPTKLSDLTDDVVSGNYLQLNGGTVGAGTAATPLEIKGTSEAWIKYIKSDGTALGWIGVNQSGAVQFYDSVAHSLAYKSDLSSYLPLTGGTLTGNLNVSGSSDTSLYTHGNASGSYIGFRNQAGNNTFGYIGVQNDNLPYFYYGSAKRIALLEEVTDEKVTGQELNPSGYWYYVPFIGTTNQKPYYNNGLKVYEKEGTTSDMGRTVFQVGNDVQTGTAGNKRGELRIYSEKYGCINLIADASTIANKTITLPNNDGTVALLSDIPSKTSDLTNDSNFVSSSYNGFTKRLSLDFWISGSSMQGKWYTVLTKEYNYSPSQELIIHISNLNYSHSNGTSKMFIVHSHYRNLTIHPIGADPSYVSWMVDWRTTYDSSNIYLEFKVKTDIGASSSNQFRISYITLTDNTSFTVPTSLVESSGRTVIDTYTVDYNFRTLKPSDNIASATKATQDGDGNTISSTYLKKDGGTVNGKITFGVSNAYGIYPSSHNFNTIGSVDKSFFEAYITNVCIGKQSTTAGSLLFYSSYHAFYSKILINTALTANRTLTMPDATGTISVSGSSSIKTKKNVTDMTDAEAEKLLSLRPVNYDYKNEDNGTNCYGLIAEEVQEVGIDYPVFTMHDNDLDEDVPALDYAKFVPYLVKVVQMQQKQIDMLKSKML